MWKYELKSIIYNKKIWLYTIIAIAVNVWFLLSSVALRCELTIQENYSMYDEYVSEYGGYVTDDKISSIDEKINELSDLITYKNKMERDYNAGEVSFATYYEALINANAYTKHLDILNCIKAQIDYVTQNDELTTVIYPNSWVHLLTGIRTRYSLIVLIILVSVPMLTRDFESNMDIVTRTCRNGKMKLYINKLIALMIFAFFECVLFGIVEYGYYFYKMGLRDCFVDIRNIETYKNVLFNAPLICSYIMQICQWFVGMVLLIMITMLVALVVKKSFFVHIFIVIYSILPTLVFDKSTLLKLISPAGFVTDGGYLFGLDEYGEELVMYTVEELVLVIMLIVIIMLVCMLISKCIIEQKKNKKLLQLANAIVIILGTCTLSGCSMNYRLDDTTYANIVFEGYEDIVYDKYTIEFDEETMDTYIRFDDKKIYLYDNAISRIYTDTVLVSDCININDKIYYSIQYDGGEFAIYEVDMNNLDNKKIYSDYTEPDSYLNYKRTINADSKFMQQLQLVSGNLLVYTDASSNIYLYNLDTKKEETFDDTGRVVGVKDKKLYYINDISELIEYDFDTKTRNKVFDEHVVQYVFWKDSIVYIDLSDLKLKEYDGNNIKVIEDNRTDIVFINNNELVWYLDDDTRKSMK